MPGSERSLTPEDHRLQPAEAGRKCPHAAASIGGRESTARLLRERPHHARKIGSGEGASEVKAGDRGAQGRVPGSIPDHDWK